MQNAISLIVTLHTALLQLESCSTTKLNAAVALPDRFCLI
jgi:hypothetical protein